MSNERKSNIELLRLISIFMIILFHCVEYGIMRTDFPDAYVRWYSGTGFNKSFSAFFTCGGDTGVGVFFIITGYFLYNVYEKPFPVKIIRKLYFYGWINAIVMFFLYINGHHAFSIIQILRSILLPVSGSTWWFASVYVLLLITYPQINKCLNQIDNKSFYLGLVLIMWGAWYVGGKILDVFYYRVLRGFFYFILGAYFAKYGIKSRKMSGLLWGVSWCLFFIVSFLIGIIVGANYNSIKIIMLVNLLKLIRRTILGPISAIGCFGFFLKSSIKHSITINKLAATTFGVYLFHDAPGIKVLLWDSIFNVSGKPYDKAWFPIYMISIAFIIMAAGMLIDCSQSIIDKHLCEFIGRKRDR